MRILLDECVPRPIKRELAGHDVHTVQEIGWSGKKNGELLKLMADQGFQALLTVDQGLQHQQNQQNLQSVGVSVLILSGATNRLADLLPLVPAALMALHSIKPGEVVEITH